MDETTRAEAGQNFVRALQALHQDERALAAFHEDPIVWIQLYKAVGEIVMDPNVDEPALAIAFTQVTDEILDHVSDDDEDDSVGA